MDLKQLEYFVNVVDLGGFSRAGRLLGIAQPAISRQIRSLEVELRQNLLLRNGRGAAPTEAGKRLLEHARGILQQVDRARREVDETKDAPVGHVVVGLPPTVARHLTLPVVREFRQRFPGGSLSIVEGLSATIHEWLLVGRVDVGVVYNPVASPAVDAKPLLDEQLCLIGAKRKGRVARTLRLADLPRLPADHSEPPERDPHARGDTARGARPQAAGRDGDRRGAGDPRARRRGPRQRRALAAGAAQRRDRPPARGRAPSCSRASRAGSPSRRRRSGRRRRSSSARSS